jgi:hypothetical protein
VKSEGSYVNGIKEGIWKYWCVNGQIGSEGAYINGKMEGLWKTWYETGQLMFEGGYVNGRLIINIPTYNIIQKHTSEDCLIHKSQIEPGKKYLMCSNREEHVMDYDFMKGFKRTENLKNFSCIYCSHKVREEIYEQV